MTIPQIVSAVWWNPFSWFDNWGFLKENHEKTALEERVKELEERLDMANNLPSTTTTVDTLKKEAVAKETNTEKTNANKKPAQETNANTAVVQFYNSAVELIDLQLKKLNLVSSDADRYIGEMPSLINKAKYGATQFPDDAEFWNLIADTYSFHRNNIANVKKTTNDYISILQGVKSGFNSKAISYGRSFVSLNDAYSIRETIDSQMSKIGDSADAITDLYSNYTNAFQQDKEIILDALELKIYSTQSAIDSLERQRSSLPAYTPPTNTNCFYYTYYGGGSINCFSY